jgi:hypothetical protein
MQFDNTARLFIESIRTRNQFFDAWMHSYYYISNTLRLKLDSLTLCIKEYYELKLNKTNASKFVWETDSSLRMDLHDVEYPVASGTGLYGELLSFLTINNDSSLLTSHLVLE